MRLHTVSESCKLGQTFTLWPISDIHLGSANCDKGAFFKTVDTIRQDPNARWIGVGDYVEWITPKDKRWHAGGIDKQIINMANLDRIGDAYVDAISTILRPIMDKCWGMGKGNHEGSFEREHHTNLTQRILQACNMPGDLYTGWAAITRVRFEDHNSHRSSIRIFHSHGWQAGRLSGAKINQLDHLMGWIEGCRIYLQGHSHDRVVKTKTMLSTNSSFTKLVAEDSFGAHCGSYLRTYQQNATGYGEEKGYPPVPIGPPTFELTPTDTGVMVKSIQGDR
ncbi:MAG: hypothetical protein WC322_05715 [Candidatus Paceibacterota bacterium]|jgi:hypothetical protein